MTGFSKQDKARLQSSYQLPKEDISEQDLNARSHDYVFYESKEAQIKRFEELCKITKKTKIPLSNSSILDVGCGLGDLYGYICSSSKDFTYFGVDISQSYINGAQKKYPDTTFAEKDIMTEQIENFDYVFACGIFNDQVTDNEAHIRAMVSRMCDIAKIGVAFNFLTVETRGSLLLPRLRNKISSSSKIVSRTPDTVNVSDLYFYKKKSILEFCRQLDGVQSATMRANYILRDATILIKKEA